MQILFKAFQWSGALSAAREVGEIMCENSKEGEQLEAQR